MISEEIKHFLDFVENCQRQHNLALEEIHTEEKRLQDFLHKIEFESSAKERSKICTQLHRSRNIRRENKDIVEETEEVVKFFQDAQHRRTLEQMKQLLGRVRKVEKYHSERKYTPRVKD